MKRNEESIQYFMGQIIHAHGKCFFGAASEMGIHPGQIPILGVLSEQDGVTQNWLVKKLGNKPSTVTVSLQRLEKNGLVRREPDEKDQRKMRIYLMDEGKKAVERAQNMMAKMEKQMVKGMSEAEVCLLKRFLKQMILNLEEMDREEKE